VSEELPEGWAAVPLRALLKEGPTNGYSPESGSQLVGTPTLKLSATTSGSMLLNQATVKRTTEIISPDSKFWLRPGDLLVQRANSLDYVGTTALYGGPPNAYIYPDLMMRLRVDGDVVDAAYLWRYLNTLRASGYFKERATGTAGNMPKINGTVLREAPVRVPPLAEQHRIVAKLEDLLARSRRAKEALDAIPPLLEKLRQSILAAAFRGDLTADWRAQHPDVEPAEKLLARIRIERRKKWEEAELAKLRAKGKLPTDDRWKVKYKEPEPVDAEGLPELPEGWAWATLDDLTFVVGGITKGQKRRDCDVVRMVPYLRVANVQRGHLNLSEMKEIEATESEIEELLLQPGDILLNEGGDRDKLGRGWVWSGELSECIHQNHVFRARPVSAQLVPRYISHYANTFGQRFFVDAGKQTTNLASVSMTKLRRFPVAVPPAAEQIEIEQRLRQHLGVVDAQRVVLREALATAASLDRATLAKAFRGELVPQDPSDEPAQALLERARRDARLLPEPSRVRSAKRGSRGSRADA
jgi:type I restriction enzyme S subunit